MSSTTGKSISLDDLIALNDEIGALTRAGVPLDRGLRALSRDLPKRLGDIAEAVSNRLEDGQSLADSLSRVKGIPEAYRAVLAAGIRSGQLAAAVEGIATTARRASEVRRVTITAMIYPVIVLAVASGLIEFTAIKTAPVVREIFTDFGLEFSFWSKIQLVILDYLRVGIPYFWIGFAVLAVLWWVRSRSPAAIYNIGIARIPIGSRLIAEGRLATFAEVLALLIEREIPLPEALPLAADATGDRHFESAGRELSERIRSGENLPSVPGGLPPLLGWLIASGHSTADLSALLRRTAAHHRQRAAFLGTWLSVYIPIFVAAGLGGLITLFYVTLVLGPFYNILLSLS